MNSNFQQAFTLLLGNEGGYVNDPNDPGGETMFGVTKRVAMRWGYMGDMKDLPQATAMSIAKSCYWDPYQLDQLPMWASFQIFDTVYNGGQAVIWAQNVVGVKADGVMGPMTIAGIRQMNQWEFVAKFNATRLRYFANLKQPTFANGRMNRIADNLLKGNLQ